MAKKDKKGAASAKAEAEDAAPEIEAPPENTPARDLATIGCPVCLNHSGFSDETKTEFCPKCNGRGQITVLKTQARTCPTCNGHGIHNDWPCKPCSHTGYVMIDAGAAAAAAEKAKAEADAAAAELQEQLDAAREEGRKLGYQEYATSESHKAELEAEFEKGFQAGQKHAAGDRNA